MADILAIIGLFTSMVDKLPSPLPKQRFADRLLTVFGTLLTVFFGLPAATFRAFARLHTTPSGTCGDLSQSSSFSEEEIYNFPISTAGQLSSFVVINYLV